MSQSPKQESRPFISIVMPTYNQKHFIGKAIQSVLDQTYQNWELIVVNNFSTDQTKTVVEDFANKGVIAASRNLAIQNARGALIAFLDSDDYWDSSKLTLCLSKIGEGYDLVCHGEYFFKDGSDELIPTKYGPEACCTFAKLLISGNCLSTSAIVLKKQVLDKIGLFDEDKRLNTAEDFDLWLRAAQAGTKIGIVDEMLGYYRLHSGSASASNLKNAKATVNVLEKYTSAAGLGILTKFKAAVFRLRVRLFIARKSFT